MKVASTTVARLAAQPITSASNHPVESPPERHAEWQMHHWCQPPQARQHSTQVTYCVRAAKTLPIAGHHPHLRHQLFNCQRRVSLRHPRVMQTDERQSMPPIQASQPHHLRMAKTTHPIPNNNIVIRKLVRVGQVRYRQRRFQGKLHPGAVIDTLLVQPAFLVL